MKLDSKEFKRFKELGALIKSGKASEADKIEYSKLEAKKNTKGSNDLQWWNNYPSLTKDVTNLPFNWIPGTKVLTGGASGNRSELGLGLIAVATMAPSIGRCVDDTDPFNAQIRQLWLDLHRKYRGIGSYEKSDLGIAILAIQNLFETIAKFERMYGIINTYHVGNRVVPTGLKDAFNIDNSLEENLADLRYQLNLAIQKVKQLCLPKGLSSLEADIIAVSNVFKDSKDRRAFLFGFDTAYYGKYDPVLVPNKAGGNVKYTRFSVEASGSTPNGNYGFTLFDVRNILNKQVNALINDEDIAKMCSDLLAAYGPENVMTLVDLPADYKIEPIEDYERSLQFHNLTICGQVSSVYREDTLTVEEAQDLIDDDYGIVIYQHDNMIRCELAKGASDYYSDTVRVIPTFGVNRLMPRGKTVDVLFDTWAESPSELEVMCGTRYTTLMGNATLVKTNTYAQLVDTCGTKVVEEVTVFYFKANAYNIASLDGTVVDSNSFTSNYVHYLKITQMDWAPMFFIADDDDLELFGDIDNFTIISSENLQRIHEVALLSGFKIPMVSAGDK